MTNNSKLIDTKLIDEIIKDCKTLEDFLGEAGIIKTFVKSVFERALNAELSTHLGYEKSQGGFCLLLYLSYSWML